MLIQVADIRQGFLSGWQRETAKAVGILFTFALYGLRWGSLPYL